MRLKRPHVASLEDVRISREEDAAIIEYLEPGISTYAGWGMRVIFVPDDRTNVQPPIEVREPEREDP
jgi:hypothetical protein